MDIFDLSGTGNISDIATRNLILSETTLVVGKITREVEERFDNHVDKVFKIAKEEYCPVDTGALKRSGKKTLVENSLTKKTWKISFGDDIAYYSAIVHERMEVPHKNPPTASAKYLERAVVENYADLVLDIANPWDITGGI